MESPTDIPTMSKMHRFMIGDVVEYLDQTDFPPALLTGTIKAFANNECSYITVDFDGSEKTVTEDEVRRVG